MALIGVVVVVVLGFTTLLTFQIISVVFYSESEKSDKFCSEALISAWGSFTCRKSMIRDPWLYFPSEGSHTMGSSPGELCSFSKLSVAFPTSQLIVQPFRRFIYVTAHSPAILLLHLRHSSFSNPSFASATSQALHLRHLASRPWIILRIEAHFIDLNINTAGFLISITDAESKRIIKTVNLISALIEPRAQEN